MKSAGISLLMWIDTIIYKFIDYVYDIFVALTKINIFKVENYQTIVNNIYVILGIIMLFVLAYSLLKAVIDPEVFSKGENSFPKLVKNVVVSLAIIAVLPTIFTVAFNFQNAILNEDTIPTLIFDKGSESYNKATDKNAGRMMSYYVLTAFLHPNFDWCDSSKDGGPYSYKDGIITNADGSTTTDVNLSSCAAKIMTDNGWFETKSESLKDVTQKFLGAGVYDSGDQISAIYDISAFNDFGDSAAEGKLTYNAFVSTIAGIFVLYVLLNFCFDMAVRVVKLMFFQIIAPIPVVCRVIPGGKLKDVFGDWMKKTISTYVDVFIRIFVIYLGVFMISLVVSNFEGLTIDGLTSSQLLIARALVIMGVVIFMRQAPKLIGDMFHLDSGSMKLGLMDKLAMGGALTAGAVLGAGTTTFTRNAVNKFGKKKNWQNKNGKVTAGSVMKNLGAGLLSASAGGLSGAVRAGKGSLNAKNFGDMKKSASEGIKKAVDKRYNREKYWASHSDGHGWWNDFGRVMTGHLEDTVGDVVNWSGYKNLDQLKLENAGMDEITSTKDAMENGIDAYIEKQMSKGKGAGLGEKIDLDGLKALKNKITEATANGGDVVGAQKDYNDALKAIRERIATQLLVSSENWSNYSNDDRAHLGELRVNAVKFKGAVYNNSNLDALKDVGIIGDNFKQSKDVTYGDAGSPLDKMGDSIKRHKGDNNVEIATRSQEQPADKK